MTTIKEQILKLINDKPKHFSTIIKHNTELYNEIKDYYGNSISEKIYNYLTPFNIICKYNNTKKFVSVFEGYRNCGKAGKCKCTQEQVSIKVSVAKQQYTIEQKVQIQEKRKQTCLEIYGVNNVGQTKNAKDAHRLFYDDIEQVAILTKQIKQTKFERYGDENYNNIEKIIHTLKSKPSYHIAKYPDKKLIDLRDKDQLYQWYCEFAIDEIAEFCKVHKHTIYRYLTQHNIREPYKSTYEQEIVNFLNKNNITNIVRNSRKLLKNRKEIDIFLPDYNIAIEYNGIYWHHDKIPHINKMYHYDKYMRCEELGIQLITIFSHIWDEKKDIIKRSLLHKLNLNGKNKIYARNCVVKRTNGSECKKLMDQYHLQGYASAQYQYGLFYNDELVALMTFNKPRMGIGKKKRKQKVSETGRYELVRYVSKYQIVGGASKLLNAFIKEFDPVKITSYSSNEWTTGNLYQQLGFTLEYVCKPGYWYIVPKQHKLYHRLNYSKHELVAQGYDPNMTEVEIAEQARLLTVWDCGKKRWVLNIK